jgi:hypothetical protein
LASGVTPGGKCNSAEKVPVSELMDERKYANCSLGPHHSWRGHHVAAAGNNIEVVALMIVHSKGESNGQIYKEIQKQ